MCLHPLASGPRRTNGTLLSHMITWSQSQLPIWWTTQMGSSWVTFHPVRGEVGWGGGEEVGIWSSCVTEAIWPWKIRGCYFENQGIGIQGRKKIICFSYAECRVLTDISEEAHQSLEDSFRLFLKHPGLQYYYIHHEIKMMFYTFILHSTTFL